MGARCKIFTPPDIANDMLDLVGYSGNMYGKRIIENSCGDGNILCAIAKRYIEGLMGRTPEYIKIGLERDICGFDIDEDCCTNAIHQLNELAQTYGITNVQWNITCANTLSQKACQEYDYIVGNPPYISYRDMEPADREFLRENYISCKTGPFDYCYAFIEHALDSLKTGGKMIYLIPSSIFKNVYGENLRALLTDHLTLICDYTSHKLFDDALTSSALILCEKDSHCDLLTYRDMASDKIWQVMKSNLGIKWNFSQKGIDHNNSHMRFGDLFSASIVIATLLNEAFVLSNFSEQGSEMLSGSGRLIERGATRRAASPRGLRSQKQERIIFPYAYKDNNLIRYSAEEFEEKFPYAVQYLRMYQEKLDKRDSDKQAAWFEYGRSQALKRLNQEKLLLSTIVTGNIEVYKLDADCIPYAGIFITPIGNASLDLAKRILSSDAFYEYVRGIGIYASGSSLRITPKDIENYEFDDGSFIKVGEDNVREAAI